MQSLGCADRPGLEGGPSAIHQRGPKSDHFGPMWFLCTADRPDLRAGPSAVLTRECCFRDSHYRKMIYFRRPLLFPTVPRVPSKIALFPTAQGQPSEITLFPMAHKPPVGNKRISDGWPPRPSEISIFLTAVTPRGPLAAHTANAHTHTRSTLHAAAARTRRRRRRPPSPAIFAGHLRRTFAGHLRRPPAPDAVVPRRPDARSAAAPTPAVSAPPPRRPHTSAAAPTPAHLPRRPHSAPLPPPLEPPAPGFARRRRLPGNGITVV